MKMLLLLFSIFILQAIPVIFCKNISFDLTIILHRNLSKIRINSIIKPEKAPSRIRHFAGKGKLPKPFKRSNVKEMLSTNEIESPNQPKLLQDYVDHLKQKGSKILNYFSKQIIEVLNEDRNITWILNTVTEEYMNMMDNYYHTIDKPDKQNELDVELIYLDMIETWTRFIFSEEKKLVNLAVSGLSDVSYFNATEILNDRVYKEIFNNKKEEIQHLCTSYDICKYYPAFSDYCADFISELLKLPDNKFKEFLSILIKVVQDNYHFFETVSEKDARELIETKLKTLQSNMRELLVAIRTVIKDRFKIMKFDEDDLITRTKAARMIIDSIDVGLSNKDEVLGKSIDNALYGLRAWANGLRKTYTETFKILGKSIIDHLDTNLSEYNKRGIAESLKVIISGRSNKIS